MRSALFALAALLGLAIGTATLAPDPFNMSFAPYRGIADG